MTVLVAVIVSAALTPLVIAVTHRWQLLDVPNHRSSHSTPTPRGGGVAVALATVAGVLVAGDPTAGIVAVLVGSLLLGAVGFADDVADLGALPRLAAQVLVPAVVALAVAGRLDESPILALVVALAVVASYVNAFNFMDGINGISAMQAIVAGCLLAAVANDLGLDATSAAGLAVAGAALGFLPFNGRSLIFLGDVGSYFVGAWLAGVALVLVSAGAPVLVVAAPFLLYLLDTSTVLVRRAARGERLTEAHREHAYQRLAQAGWSHLQVAALCAVVSAVCAGAMFVTIDSSFGVQLLVALGCVALVAVYLALPSVVARSGAMA